MKNIAQEKIPALVQLAAESIGILQADTTRLLDRIKDLLGADEDEAEEKAPRQKMQLGILVSSPTASNIIEGLPAWVFALPEEESVHTMEAKVRLAAHAFNCTKKGRLLPVKTIGEAIEAVPAKLFKEQGLVVKTKVPVIIMTTNNELGEAPSV